MERQHSQESNACKEVNDFIISHHHSQFQSFVDSLGSLMEQQLNYSECNRHLKIKSKDYASNQEVLQYYHRVFRKRTCVSIRKKWHIKDKFLLFWMAAKLCEKKGIPELRMRCADWQEVSQILQLPREFLMRKWICLIRHTTFQHHWSSDEEGCLKELMSSNQLGTGWSDLSIRVFEQSGSDVLRTCKDIREHWKNYLDPKIKREVWTCEQDSSLLQQVFSQGKKWSLIARILEGRTENQVKNRYLSLTKREAREHIQSHREEMKFQAKMEEESQKPSPESNHHDTHGGGEQPQQPESAVEAVGSLRGFTEQPVMLGDPEQFLDFALPRLILQEADFFYDV